MNTKHRELLNDLKRNAEEFHEDTSFDIDNLCNDINFGFREASRLSHILDRLDLFVKELKEFCETAK